MIRLSNSRFDETWATLSTLRRFPFSLLGVMMVKRGVHHPTKSNPSIPDPDPSIPQTANTFPKSGSPPSRLHVSHHKTESTALGPGKPVAAPPTVSRRTSSRPWSGLIMFGDHQRQGTRYRVPSTSNSTNAKKVRETRINPKHKKRLSLPLAFQAPIRPQQTPCPLPHSARSRYVRRWEDSGYTTRLLGMILGTDCVALLLRGWMDDALRVCICMCVRYTYKTHGRPSNRLRQILRDC